MEFLTRKQKKDIRELLSHLLKQTKNKKIKWDRARSGGFYCDFNGVRISVDYDKVYSSGDFINTKRACLYVDQEQVFGEKWELFPGLISRKIRKIYNIKTSRNKAIRTNVESEQIQKHIDKAKEVCLIEKLSGI